MNFALSRKALKLLEHRVKRGGYRSADEAVRAGLAYLEQQEHACDFEPGELDKLLAVANEGIARGELLDGEAVFAEIRKLGKQSNKRRASK